MDSSSITIVALICNSAASLVGVLKLVILIVYIPVVESKVGPVYTTPAESLALIIEIFDV
jgi:hypothetical protein